MPDKDQYIQQIIGHYPDLGISTAEFNHDGQYNDVLIVNDALVFRFAKVQPAIETLKQEIAILNHIQGKIDTPVPEPAFTAIDTDKIGDAYMGYKRIPGTPLMRETFKAIPAASKPLLAEQIAGFLKTLHSIKPLDSFPTRDTVDIWEDMFDRIQKKLFPLMRQDAHEQVSGHFQSFLNSPSLFTPRLRHGDFGTGNILINPETYHLAGIIDFGFAGVGDPATDFAGLLICYGVDFYGECARHYPEMQTALPRARFYIETFALQEALFGIENDDTDALKAGLKTYI